MCRYALMLWIFFGWHTSQCMDHFTTYIISKWAHMRPILCIVEAPIPNQDPLGNPWGSRIRSCWAKFWSSWNQYCHDTCHDLSAKVRRHKWLWRTLYMGNIIEPIFGLKISQKFNLRNKIASLMIYNPTWKQFAPTYTSPNPVQNLLSDRLWTSIL